MSEKEIAWGAKIITQQSEITALKSEVKRLNELAWSLDDYAIHTPNLCKINTNWTSPCTCGLDKLGEALGLRRENEK